MHQEELYVPKTWRQPPVVDPTKRASLDFTVLDFETATGRRNSVCQAAIAVVRDGKIIGSKDWLIQPPDNEYSHFNTMIHGLTAEKTANSPRFIDIWEELKTYLDGEVVLMHNAAFDIDCLRQSLALHNLEAPFLWYNCTYQMSKTLFPDMKNHKLSTLCTFFNIYLNHHDALSDVEATANLALTLAEEHDIEGNDQFYTKSNFDWGRLTPLDHLPCFYRYNNRPSENKSGKWEGSLGKQISIKKEVELLAESEQKFKDKTIVFTGELSRYTREEVEYLAKQHGARVTVVPSNKTDIVVVGEYLLKPAVTKNSHLPDKSKEGMSGKERKARDLVAKGSKIEIMNEWHFLKIVEH
jgi:DNA polymerase III subunit epsilon